MSVFSTRRTSKAPSKLGADRVRANRPWSSGDEWLRALVQLPELTAQFIEFLRQARRRVSATPRITLVERGQSESPLVERRSSEAGLPAARCVPSARRVIFTHDAPGLRSISGETCGHRTTRVLRRCAAARSPSMRSRMSHHPSSAGFRGCGPDRASASTADVPNGCDRPGAGQLWYQPHRRRPGRAAGGPADAQTEPALRRGVRDESAQLYVQAMYLDEMRQFAAQLVDVEGSDSATSARNRRTEPPRSSSCGPPPPPSREPAGLPTTR